MFNIKDDVLIQENPFLVLENYLWSNGAKLENYFWIDGTNLETISGTMVQFWKPIQKDGEKLENYFEHQNIYQNNIVLLMSILINKLNVKVDFLIQVNPFPTISGTMVQNLETIYGTIVQNWKTISGAMMQNWKTIFGMMVQNLKTISGIRVQN